MQGTLPYLFNIFWSTYIFNISELNAVLGLYIQTQVKHHLCLQI